MDDEISSSQVYQSEGLNYSDYLTEEEFLNSDFTPFTQSMMESDLEDEREVRLQEAQDYHIQ